MYMHICTKLTVSSQYVSTLQLVSIKPDKEVEFTSTLNPRKSFKNKQVDRFLILNNAPNQTNALLYVGEPV